MKLTELQDLFVKAIRGDIDPRIQALIEPGGRLAKDEAIQVYQNDYFARMPDALGETFEGVWSLLGDEEYYVAARVYLDVYAPYSHNLGDFGHKFGDFLTERYPEISYIGDLADFEWSFKELFHRAYEKGLGPEAFADLNNPEHTGFSFVSSFELRNYKNGIYELWTHREDPERANIEIDTGKPDYLLLYKQEQEIFIHTLHPLEYLILRELKVGVSLSEAIEAALEEFEKDPETAGGDELIQKMITNLFTLISQKGLVRQIFKPEFIA